MSTPKPRTEEFVALRDRLRSVLEPGAMRWLASGALDRGALEKIVVRLGGPPGGGPIDRSSRTEIVEIVSGAFFAGDDGAFRLLLALDRATRAEQGLVASMSPREVNERLGGHAALRLRRHGAKLSWAMVRDERPDVAPIATRVLRAYVEHAERVEQTREVARSKGAEAQVRELEEMYRDAAERALDLEVEISAADRERARLVAEIGRREMDLRQQVDQSKDLLAQVKRLEDQLAARGEGRPRRPTGDRSGDGPREGGSARLAELEEENAHLRATLDRLRELRAAELATRRAAARETDAESTKTTPVVEAPRRGRAKRERTDVRVGVFVDVANLSGAARRLFDAAVDYPHVLSAALGGRRLVEARAYAIDKGGGFDAFAHSLRRAGFKVSGKKPRVFDGGEMKADWDVGITVDVLTRHDEMDIVILGTGDGDFVPVVAALKRQGLQVEAVGFRERTAEILLKAVDRFIDLDDSALVR